MGSIKYLKQERLVEPLGLGAYRLSCDKDKRVFHVTPEGVYQVVTDDGGLRRELIDCNPDILLLCREADTLKS